MASPLLAIPGYREAAELVLELGLVFDRPLQSGFICDGGGCAMVEILRKMGKAGAVTSRLMGEDLITEALLGRGKPEVDEADDPGWWEMRDAVVTVTQANDDGLMTTPEEVRKYLLEVDRLDEEE